MPRPRGVKKDTKTLPPLPKEISQYRSQTSVSGGFDVPGGAVNGKVRSTAHLTAKCQQCGATNPPSGFAPVYQELDSSQLVLLCNDCWYRAAGMRRIV